MEKTIQRSGVDSRLREKRNIGSANTDDEDGEQVPTVMWPRGWLNRASACRDASFRVRSAHRPISDAHRWCDAL